MSAAVETTLYLAAHGRSHQILSGQVTSVCLSQGVWEHAFPENILNLNRDHKIACETTT